MEHLLDFSAANSQQLCYIRDALRLRIICAKVGDYCWDTLRLRIIRTKVGACCWETLRLRIICAKLSAARALGVYCVSAR